jgi:microcystin-dependent protein
MSEPFLAEIRMVGFNFAPRGWGFCDGQILPINQNQSLYSLLGTTYGGDGRTSFALPDMRGRTAIHVNSNHRQGQKSGEDNHTLIAAEMPQHKHTNMATTESASQPTAGNNLLAKTSGNIYAAATAEIENANAMSNAGGGQAHENMQPYCAVNFCIALQGLFPSRN